MKKRWLSALTLLVIAFVAVFSFGCAYVFEKETFTVTFMSNGVVVSEEDYEAGEEVVFPEDPASYSDDHYEYTFLGWNYNFGDPNSECVTELTVAHHDVTLYAAFKREAIVNTGSFRVRFRDGITGELLKSEDVPAGGSATAPTPTDHTDTHMAFSHWSESFENVTASMEIYAIYSGVPYPVQKHVLDEVREAEVPFGERLNRHILDLGSGDGIPLAFKFEGWYFDKEYTRQINAEDLMPAPEKVGEPLHVYAKFSIRSFTDTSNTATIDTSGALIYGGGDDYLYVRNLDDADGLVYTYDWNVTFNQKPFHSSENQYDLLGAGEYAVSVNVTANYKNGVFVQSKQISRTATVTKAVLSLSNIGIDRNTLVYGEGAPRATFDASGFQYEDGEELFCLTYRYVLGGKTQDSAGNNDDLKTVRLPVGRYALIAELAELANYTVECEDLNGNGVADLEEISFSVTKKEVRLELAVENNTYGEGFLPTLTFMEGYGLAYGEAFDPVTGGVLGAPEYIVAGRANSGKAYSGAMEYGFRIYAGENYSASVKGMNENGNYTVVYPAEVNFAIARRDFNVTVYVNETSFIYGEIPQFTFTTNALEDDRENFSVNEWAYTLDEGASTAYNVTRLLDVGSYAITVFSADFERLGDNYANYNAPEQNNISVANFEVEKTSLKIGIAEINDYTYGDYSGKEPVPVATFEGFVKNPNGEYQKAEVLGGTFYWTYYAADSSLYSTTDSTIGTRVEGNYAVGTYTIAPSGYTSRNYEIEFLSTELTISKASLNLTIGLSNLNYANELIYGTRPSLGYTNGISYAGFVENNGTYETVSDVFKNAVPTVTYFDAQNKAMTAEDVFHVGSFTADLLAETLANAKAAATNYEITVTPKAFKVTPKQLTITPIVVDFTYGATFTPDFVAVGFAYDDGKDALDISGAVYIYQKGGASYTGNLHEGKTYFDAGNYTVNVAGFEAKDYTFRYSSSTFSVAVRSATVNISATGATYGADPIVSYAAPDILDWDVVGFDFTYKYQWYVNNAYRDYDSKAYNYFQAAEYRVTLSYKENANYTITYEAANFKIAQKALSITVSVDDLIYGAKFTPKFSSYEGFVNGENENTSGIFSGTPVYTVDGKEYAPNDFFRAGVGKGYTVTSVSGVTAKNYAITFVADGGFNVDKATLTVTISGASGFIYGEKNVPALNATITGFVLNETAATAGIEGAISYAYVGDKYGDENNTANGRLRADTYTIAASGLSAANYEFDYVYENGNNTFTVAPKDVTITLSRIGNYTYGELETTFAPSITAVGLLVDESNLEAELLQAVLVSYFRNGTAYTPNTAFFDAGSYAATMNFVSDFNRQANGYENYNLIFKYESESSSAEKVAFNIEKAKFNINPTLPSMSPTKGANWAYAPAFGIGGFFASNGFQFNGTIQLQSANLGTYDATNEETFNASFKWKEGEFSITLNGVEVTDNFELTYDFSLLISSSSYTVTPYLSNAAEGTLKPYHEGYSAGVVYNNKEFEFTVTASALDAEDNVDESVEIVITYSLDQSEWRTDPYSFLYVADSKEIYYRITAFDKGTTTESTKYDSQIGTFKIDIAKAAAKITVEDITTTYDGAEHTITSGATLNHSETTVQFKDNTYQNAKTYTVTVYSEETANYTEAEETFTVIVNKAPLDVTELTYAASTQYTAPGIEWQNASVNGVKGNDHANEVYAIAYSATYVPKYGSGTYESGKNLVNAGDYAIIVSVELLSNNYYIDDASYVEGGDYLRTYNVEITQISGVITVKTIDSIPYDGSQHNVALENYATANHSESALVYSYEGDASLSGSTFTFTNVPLGASGDNGTYTITVTLPESANYKAASETIEITVNKAQGSIGGVQTDYTYDGTLQTVSGAKFFFNGNEITIDGVEFEYINNTFTTVAEGNGKEVTITMPESRNFVETSTTVTIEVKGADITVNAPRSSQKYAATDYFNSIQLKENEVTGVSGETLGTNFSVTYGLIEGSYGSSVELFNAEKYVVYYQITGANYETKTGTIEFEITKAKLEVSIPTAQSMAYSGNPGTWYMVDLSEADLQPGDTFSDIEYTFQSSYSEDNIQGFDDIINAGAYTISCTISVKNSANEDVTNNYEFIYKEGGNVVDSGEFKITITQSQDGEIVTSGVGTNYTYDGTLQMVNSGAKFFFNSKEITIDGVELIYSNNTFTTVAEGNGKEVTITMPESRNFVETSATVTITVNKADAVISGTKDIITTYDGEEHTITSGATVNHSETTVQFKDNTYKNADTYTVTVYVEETDNYKAASTTFTVIVNKANAPAPTNLPEPIDGGVRYVGKMLSDIPISDTAFRWAEDQQLVGEDIHAYAVIYNPNSKNYEDYVGSLTISVITEKTAITLTPSAEIAVNYGSTAADAVEQFDYSLSAEDRVIALDETELTYLADKFNISISGVDFNIGSTYLAIFNIELNDDYYEIADGADPAVLLKIKSVQIGKNTPDDNTVFYTIEDALNEASGTDTVTVEYDTSFATAEIAALAGYTVENGNYTVKSNVTLLVPYAATAVGYNKSTLSTSSATDRANGKTFSRNYNSNEPGPAVAAISRSGGYAMLKVTSGVNLTVANKGNLVVNAVIVSSASDTSRINGAYYGEMIVEKGATITLESGSTFDCMGFTRGEGEIFAMSGSNVYEPFNMSGWKGGSISSSIQSTLFPISQYAFTSLVTKTTFAYGSNHRLRAFVSANAIITTAYVVAEVGFISNETSSFIQMGTEASITKWIDESNGKMHFDLKGSITLHNLSLDLGSAGSFNTSGKLVPIPGNMAITIQSGKTTVPNGVGLKLLPGALVRVEKNATLSLANGSKAYAYGSTTTTYPSGRNQFNDGKLAGVSDYPNSRVSASYRVAPNMGYTGASSAQVIVNGKVEVGSTAIATIEFSSEGEGVLEIAQGATLSGTLQEDDSISGSIQYYSVTLTSAGLNGDNSITEGLSAGTHTYRGSGASGKWIGPNTWFTIEYHYGYLDNGSFVEIAASPNNPNAYTPMSAIVLANATANDSSYAFIGWYRDSACTKPIQTLEELSENISLYALFQKVNTSKYVIEYSTGYPVANEGDSFTAITIGSEELDVDAVAFIPDTAGLIKSGDSEANIPFKFVGWYLDSNYNTEFSMEALKAMYPNGGVAVTLYAKWEAKIYNITLSVGQNSTLSVAANGETMSTSGTLKVPYGAEVTFTYGANDGYTSEISITPEGYSTSPFSMPASNVTIKTSATKESSGGGCIVEGTLVMLADGTQKPIEDILPGDEVLVFNHETGKYEVGKMWFIDDIEKSAQWNTVINLEFSDGTKLRISYQHALFDLDLNRYVYINEENYSEFVGHRFTNVTYVNSEFISGEIILTKAYLTEEYVRIFGPVSEYHMNLVTDSLLTMPSYPYNITGFINIFEYGEGMKYDEEAMQRDIELYGLFTYEDFAEFMSYEDYLKTPAKWLKVALGKGILRYEEIELIIQFLYEEGGFTG